MSMIGPVVAATMPLMREHAESLMVDTVTVEHPTGATLDPTTLEEVTIYSPVYTGAARVRRPAADPRNDVAGGFEFGVRTFLAYLPVSVTGITQGDRVTITAIDSLTDPELLGLVGTVEANLTRTYAAKRSLVCEEVGE